MSQRILDDQLLIPSTVRSESKQRLQDALARLGGTDAGRLLLDAIRGQGATLHFGPTGADVTYFDFARNEIVVDEGLADTSTNVLVQHLAHEGVHAQWGWPDSIEQE